MKLVTFTRPDEATDQRVGAIAADGRSLLDLAAVAAACDPDGLTAPSTMLDFLQQAAAGRDQVRQLMDSYQAQRPPNCLVALDHVRLLSPVPQPTSIRDCMNFERHVIQSTRTAVRWRFPWLARS